jgi:hypothetical protein
MEISKTPPKSYKEETGEFKKQKGEDNADQAKEEGCH